jgi:membrane protein implicated in regulation of membrane protease activity
MHPELLHTVFLVCFLVGGTLMLLQFLLGLLGLGGHHDVGGDVHDVGGAEMHDMGGHDAVGHDGPGHDAAGHEDHGHSHGSSHTHTASSNWLVGVLTFRTIVAAITFFGLAGLAAAAQGSLDPWQVLAIALAAGAGAMFLVAWVMRSLARLNAEGTARIERALGKSGTVYLTVPGNKEGIGKVHLNLQNRTVECQAVTAHPTLPNGTKVVVTAVIGRDTVEVAPAPETEKAPHV